MKKFVVYEWSNDGEGGYGVCQKEQYSSEWNSTTCIGEFNTKEELLDILIKVEYTKEDAMWWVNILSQNISL